MNTKIEIFEKLFNVLNLVFIAGGSVATWFYMAKYNKNRNISSAVKETKINTIDGDKALVEQIDMLLIKFSTMSKSMLEVQAQVSKLTNIEYSYGSAIRRIKVHCNEFCKDAEFCKNCMNVILKELNLPEEDAK